MLDPTIYDVPTQAEIRRTARDDLVDDIIRDVAELPDRTSPEGWPEAMLVTEEELRRILTAHIRCD